MCNFCKETFYVKTIQCTMPLLAPMTRAEELRQELQNITGEVFIPLLNEYCPMCGEKKE
jgi:hypothetical protein